MKPLALVLLILGILLGQPPGTITVGGNHNVTALAGGSTCTLQLKNGTRVHTVCSASGTTAPLTQDITPTASSGMGGAGNYQVNGNMIGWIITRSSSSAVQYQIAANGTLKTGIF